MKLNRTGIFIAISSMALLIVLIIQVNWIIRTAKIKEEIFNEKANMVLSKTAEALSADTSTCRQMEECVGKNEMHKTDSLFSNYMQFYNFHIDYAFEVKKPGAVTIASESGLKNNVYKKRLEEEATKNGLELNLFLPEKRQFIVQEMGPMFITSVILILVVLVMFWRTILLLMREKQISEHTTDFLNNMTHEFKTPLTNIALAGKMIIKDSNFNREDRIKHYSGIILEENEKLRLQVEQVLSMTALERDEIPLRKVELDFHALIHDSLKCISIQIENRQGEIKLNLDAEKFVIMGDKTHLTNALCNLIDNAIKYSNDNPKLSIQTWNNAHHLVVVVSDKGIGIEKEHQKKVFDKYFRVPTGDVHNVKGFGLGLAYVKKIVELHGGTVELQSEKGMGTTFTITLTNVEG
ncbi:MAG TPA: HAMP domain-containing sensor histidine kinase [Bacteroidia bacterium]|nr:HAMP domain-containing sensor histidine kinase [Bacteroidia bacterium]